MKELLKLPFYFAFSLLCFGTLAQQDVPTAYPEGHDYQPPILTLSKGQYVELIETDSVVRIADALYNPYTEKVVAILEEGQYLEVHNESEERFLSLDPLAKEFAWNSPYAFSENRLLDAIELEGLELFLIHGTWGDNADLKPVLSNKIQTIFGNSKTVDYGWSGDNLDLSRKEAAKEYVAIVKANREPGESITIFSHSHGGNVGIMVMNELVNDPELEGVELNLVTLNTPVREYQLSEKASSRVKHYQIYNDDDPVQALGGNKMKIGKGIKFLTGEFGKAQRTFDSAININYNSHGFLHQNHTGWNIKNQNEWLPQLEEKVNPVDDYKLEIPDEKSILGNEGM